MIFIRYISICNKNNKMWKPNIKKVIKYVSTKLQYDTYETSILFKNIGKNIIPHNKAEYFKFLFFLYM